MPRTPWAWARTLGGAVVLGAVVLRWGAAPFLDAVRQVDGGTLALAAGIAAVTTVAAAWRWRLVAAGLGVALPLRAAVAAYYRSQFLNATLPGGVLGDVHRAVRHGRDVGDVGRAARAVGWERCAGQAVQAVLTLVVLLALPSPVGVEVPLVGLVALVALLGGFVLLRRGSARPSSGVGRLAVAVATDLRAGVLARRAWPGVLLASVVVVAGHVVTFLVAARAIGSTAPLHRLLPLALLVLLAAAVPLNLAGWGPREGIAAWAFGAAGLGAAQGISAAAAYGMLALVSTLPGAAVLVVARRRRPAAVRQSASEERVAARIGTEVGARG